MDQSQTTQSYEHDYESEEFQIIVVEYYMNDADWINRQ